MHHRDCHPIAAGASGARAQGVTELEAIFTGENAALTRFANNTIHQNVTERSVKSRRGSEVGMGGRCATMGDGQGCC